MNKKRFVEFYLAAMIRNATEGAVPHLVYEEQGDSEQVNLVYASGGVIRVNVTGDSLIAIAKDVTLAVM